jgi:hypothetical protein
MSGRQMRIDILLTPTFVVALLILLLNDHLLKYLYPNWLTGKLSDFAGLFAFASLFYAFFPRHKTLIGCTIGLGFVLWKSPLSQPIIDFWNGLNIVPVARVVDYSDLLAVSILPVAAYHFSIAQKRNLQPKLAYSIFLVSLLGILGTSVPRTFLAHQFQFDSNQPPKLTVIQSGVHEIASRFGLTCHRCDPRDPYRLYASERISLETNFNIESNILYMNASEFNRSEPSSLSKEITLRSRIR